MSRGDGRRMMAINPAACRGLRGFGGAAPAAAPAWTPASITGVAEWWRADLGVTDAGGGSVSAWQGQVAGETLSQGTAAARPTLTTRDSQSVLSFDGGDYLGPLTFATLGTLTQPVTHLAIVEITTGGLQHIDDGDDASDRQFMLVTAVTALQITAGSNLTGPAISTGASHAILGEFNGASSKAGVDNLAAPTTGNAGTVSLNGLTIGANFLGSNRLKGGSYLWEYILVDGAISAGDRALLGAYLDARYAGLSLTY